MEEEKWHDQLAEFLKIKGHADDEIAKIVAKVEQYDQQMQVDSLMDSIGSGQFDLDKLIQEALAE